MEESENGSIGVGELCSVDLSLQNQNLVTESENLRVTRIATGEHPPEPGQNEASESRNESHKRRTPSAGRTFETPDLRGRMSIRRHPQGEPGVRNG